MGRRGHLVLLRSRRRRLGAASGGVAGRGRSPDCCGGPRRVARCGDSGTGGRTGVRSKVRRTRRPAHVGRRPHGRCGDAHARSVRGRLAACTRTPRIAHLSTSPPFGLGRRPLRHRWPRSEAPWARAKFPLLPPPHEPTATARMISRRPARARSASALPFLLISERSACLLVGRCEHSGRARNRSVGHRYAAVQSGHSAATRSPYRTPPQRCRSSSIRLHRSRSC